MTRIAAVVPVYRNAATLGPLADRVGQHEALRRGLAAEPDGAAWVCLDADLQDPPEAVPALLDRLEGADAAAVFAGRRGAYETPGRLLTGRLHRMVLRWLTGLPGDAGAFVALSPRARDAVLRLGGPSVVAAIGVSRVAVHSVPVARSSRPTGSSSWSAGARARQSAGALAWTARRARLGRAATPVSAPDRPPRDRLTRDRLRRRRAPGG